MKGKDLEAKINMLVSRCLAAFAIETLTGVDKARAAAAVVDGPQDMGIDAIYTDPLSSPKICWMVQSKFKKDGLGLVGLGDARKFVEGVRRIGKNDRNGANRHITRMEADLHRVGTEFDWVYVAVLASTSRKLVDDVTEEMIHARLDDRGANRDLFSFRSLNLSAITSAAKEINDDIALDLHVTIRDFGRIEKPVDAFYGRVKVSDITGWRKHGRRLFAENVREYLGSDTEVSRSIAWTLGSQTSSDMFWYLNNGVTIIRDSHSVKGPHRDSPGNEERTLLCKNALVVNGAQTIGTIWRECGDGEKLSANACLGVRVISLEKTPPGFGREVTIATNTQERVSLQDFAALEPVQKRIASEFGFFNLTYSFRRTEHPPEPRTGCTIDELAAVIAVQSSVGLAVETLRNRGRLTQPRSQSYRAIFDRYVELEIDAPEAWLTVQMFRATETELGAIQKMCDGRSEQVATHGARFIQYRVMRGELAESLRRRQDFRKDPQAAVEQLPREEISAAVRQCHEMLTDYLNSHHSDEYLQVIFKNTDRLEKIDRDLGPITAVNGTKQDETTGRLGLIYAD